MGKRNETFTSGTWNNSSHFHTLCPDNFIFAVEAVVLFHRNLLQREAQSTHYSFIVLWLKDLSVSSINRTKRQEASEEMIEKWCKIKCNLSWFLAAPLTECCVKANQSCRVSIEVSDSGTNTSLLIIIKTTTTKYIINFQQNQKNKLRFIYK